MSTFENPNLYQDCNLNAKAQDSQDTDAENDVRLVPGNPDLERDGELVSVDPDRVDTDQDEQILEPEEALEEPVPTECQAKKVDI